MWREYVNLPRTVLLLCLGSLINRAGTMVIPFLTLYLNDELQTGEVFATSALSVFGAGSIVAQLIGGSLADRIGRKTVMVAALGSATLILPVLAQVTQPVPLLIGIFLFAMCAETYRPAAHAMVADVTSPEQRSTAFGLMYVSINLGFGIAAGVGGLLAARSFQLLFWVDAATCGAFALLMIALIPETLRRTDDASLATGTASGSGTEAAPAWHRWLDLSAYRRIASHCEFMMFCLATMLLSVLFTQSVGALPLAMSRAGFDQETFGWVVMTNGIMICLMQIAVTRWVAPLRRSRVLFVASVLIGLGFAANYPATAAWHYAVAVGIWTIGEMMQAPIVFAVASNFAPQDLRGRYMGVLSMSFSTATVIGPPFGGALLAWTGPAGLWGACLLVGVAAAMLFTSVARSIDVEVPETSLQSAHS